MRDRLPVILFYASLSFLLSSCGSWQQQPAPNYETQALATCYQQYQQLHRAVDLLKVRRRHTPIPGYPFLRSNRFLASFAEDATISQAHYRAWLLAMNNLASEALLGEFELLPFSKRADLLKEMGIRSLAEFDSSVCGKLLVNSLVEQRHLTGKTIHSTDIKSEYGLLRRIFGLYPVSSALVKMGVKREHSELMILHQSNLLSENNLDSNNWLFPPADEKVQVSESGLVEGRKRWDLNSLGMPELSNQQKDELFARYAPVLSIESYKEDDTVGAVVAGPVDSYQWADSPRTAYTHLSYARYGEGIVLQLNYSFWFPRRASSGSLDILAGEYDALIWRVNLLSPEDVLAYDSIHQCGCWYRVYPGGGFTLGYQGGWFSEPVIAPPMAISANRDRERVVLQLEPGTHQLVGVNRVSKSKYDSVANESNVNRRYGFEAFSQLYRLPSLDGAGKASTDIFNAKGIMSQSRRLERWLFWVTGVENAGAMRDFQHHAISFVGTRHFDDPYLFAEIGLIKSD